MLSPRRITWPAALLVVLACGPKSTTSGAEDGTSSTEGGVESTAGSSDEGDLPDHCPDEAEIFESAAAAMIGAEVPCAIPEPAPLDGIVECAEGMEHRPYPGLVDTPKSPGVFLSQCEQSGGPCESDGDCGDGPLGECVVGEHDAACQCFYGCRCDADCPSDRACFRGECISADCSVDSDCGDYACARTLLTPVGAMVMRDKLACQTPDDECRSTADCDPDPTDCTACVLKGELWVCDGVCGD